MNTPVTHWRVTYDQDNDVLYASQPNTEAHHTHTTPEGHAVRYDQHANIIGVTLINARWLTKHLTEQHPPRTPQPPRIKPRQNER